MGSNSHMEKKIRHKFGKHVSAAFISSILVRGMSLALVKILTTTLLKEEYALYAFWLSFVVLSSSFSTSAFSASLWRFLQRRVVSDDENGAPRLLGASLGGAFIFHLFVYVLLAMSFQLFEFQLIDDPIYLTTLVAVGILGFFYVLRELLLVVSGTEQNSREILIFTNFFGATAYAAACIAAFIYGNHLFILLGLSVGYLMPVMAVLVMKTKQYGLSKPTGPDFIEILTFGGPNIVIASVVAFVPFLASYLIGHWIGLTGIAALSIALAVAGLLTFVVRPPQNAYRAYMVNAYETGAYNEGAKISVKILNLFLVFSVPAVYVLVLMSPLLIAIISTTDYLEATVLIPFTVVYAAMMALSHFWRIQIELVERPYLTGIIYAISAVALVISCVCLIPTAGLVGAGFAMTIQAAVALVLMFIVGNRLLPIKMDRRFGIGFITSTITITAIGVLLTMFGIPNWLLASGMCFFYIITIDLTGTMKIREMVVLARLLLGREGARHSTS